MEINNEIDFIKIKDTIDGDMYVRLSSIDAFYCKSHGNTDDVFLKLIIKGNSMTCTVTKSDAKKITTLLTQTFKCREIQ